MAQLTIQNINKTFSSSSPNEDDNQVLKELSLHVKDGEFIAFFGPNGCGKTTLLNCLAGIISPDSGNIAIDGKNPEEAKIGYIFQDYRETLLPWAKTIDNIAYPLCLQGVSKRERYEMVRQLLKKLDITLQTGVWPTRLSGGQQQLVAIARALICQPDVMLFDEPFSALDIDSRLQMHAKLQDIWKKTNTTTFFVSHELDEALLLADRVVMLSKCPAQFLEIIKIPFGRPRNQELLEKEAFFNIRKHALRIFREAIAK